MFLKPFRIKSQTAIKGSDRKKLRAEIGRQYPGIPAEQLPDLVPNKEEMSTMKLYSHSGQNVIVYILHKTPIFFELDKEIFPTVYLLWKFPEVMPVLTTWPPVLTKLLGGADLMLPGLVVKGELCSDALGNLAKNQPCAIKLVGSKAPVAVGRTTMSSRDMITDAGMKGKGVRIIHMYRDHLWELGEKTHPPVIEDQDFYPEMLDEEDTETEKTADPTESQNGENNSIESPDSGIPNIDNLSIDEERDKIMDGACGGVKPSPAAAAAATSQEEEDGGGKEKMDELLYWCFLCAIKTKVKKGDLPLLTSTFYKNYLQACCPKGKTVDIKKSSYKKLGKFLADMSSRGFISLRELQFGVESIMEIYKDHHELRGFKVDGLVGDEGGLDADQPAGEESANFQPPQITEMFMITSHTQHFFRPFGYNKGNALTSVDIRQALTQYVKDNELQKQQSVTLDGPLSDLVLNKGEYIEHLTWEEVFTRCQAKMSPAYRVSAPGHPPAVKKGKLEPVLLNVHTRSGNKKVTLIENLEVYGINPLEFAHTVQIGVACSTSTNPLPGKGRGLQVLVQGNQINYVANILLEKYQLQRKWIQGVEKAPKGKKTR